MSTKRSSLFVIVLLVVVVVLSNLPTATVAAPSYEAASVVVVINPTADYGQHDPRPDACRTYLHGGYDAADGVACLELVAPKAVNGKQVELVEPTLVVVPPVVVIEPPVVVVPPVVIEPPVVDAPVQDTCTNANPGNTKCVGKATEDPNNKGTMPVDNAGGNGNGQHGNQGQGGNKNK